MAGICLLSQATPVVEERDGRAAFTSLFPVSTGNTKPFPSFLPRFVTQTVVDTLAVRTNALQEALTKSLEPSKKNNYSYYI